MQQPNYRRQIIVPAVPKLQNDHVTRLLKIALFCGIFFSIYYSTFPNFNSIFAYIIEPSYGASYAKIIGQSMPELLRTVGGNVLVATVKIFTPLISAIVLFLLYHVYARMFARLICGQYAVLNEPFDIRKFRICLDSSFILLTVLKGVAHMIFVYYPLALNMGAAIVDILSAVIAFAVFLIAFSAKMPKRFYAIHFYLSAMPLTALLICV